MTWSRYHTQSEQLANEAESEERLGNIERATELYDLAAAAELCALDEADITKSRTVGITAVSAVALLYKAGNFAEARHLGEEWLGKDDLLPPFAIDQIHEILTEIDAKPAQSAVVDGAGDDSSEDRGADLRAVLRNIVRPHMDVDVRVSALQGFLWFLSGADTTVLRRPSCRTEREKYAAIGASILFISVLAGLSGAYALFLVFESVILACVCGVFWGLLILNMYRFLGGSIRRSADKGVGRKQLVSALPRIAFAFIIALVIATPIELKMFENEIAYQVSTYAFEREQSVRAMMAPTYREIAELAAENREIEEQLIKKQEERDKLYTALLDEASGRTGTKVAGKGPIFRTLTERLSQVQRELEEQRNRSRDLIDNNYKRIGRLTELRDSRLEASVLKFQDGLLARLNGLLRLTKENLQFTMVHWSIVSLLLMLGTAPLLIRLFAARGAYDMVLEAIEYEIVLSEQRKRVEVEIQADMDLVLRKELMRLVLDRKLNYLRDALTATK